MLPLPDAAQLPPVAEHVQAHETSAAGNASLVSTDATFGPAFEAVIVYVTELPGTALVTPSVFVIETSESLINESVSVALLLPETGSLTPAGEVMLAVLARLSFALTEAMLQLAV